MRGPRKFEEEGMDQNTTMHKRVIIGQQAKRVPMNAGLVAM